MISPCNFSVNHYFDVLEEAKKEYVIGPLRNLPQMKKNNKFIILRHDVDYSLNYALEMAKQEADNEINSTYFVLLHSPLYSALEPKNIQIIKKISGLGHEVGLHYDVNILKSSKKILELIKNEIKLLEIILQVKINSIVQHNVSSSKAFGLSSSLDLIDAYYSKELLDVKYISDSVRNWRESCMCNHINKYDKIQILTHPMWWSTLSLSRNEIYKKFEGDKKQEIFRKIRLLKKFHKQYLKKIKNQI